MPSAIIDSVVVRFLFHSRRSAILVLLQTALLAEGRATFGLEGELQPAFPAVITVHGVDTPFTGSVAIQPGGGFKFKRLAAGTYTIAVYVPKLGELRQTQAVGPGTADRKGRVRVTIFCNRMRAMAAEEHTVSIQRLSIPPAASKEYQEAQKSLARGDAEGAVVRLKKAVEIAPHFSAAWNNLGTIAYQQRRFPDAESFFRSALKADPDSYEPKVNLGGVLLTLGKLDEAMRFNADCVLAKPKDALANSQLGLTYFGKGDLALAERYLLEARRLDPAHFSHPQLALAQIYQRQGKNEAAVREIEDLLRRHPDHPQSAELRQAAMKLRAP
jgi:Tfp pilus assembly protein PilF